MASQMAFFSATWDSSHLQGLPTVLIIILPFFEALFVHAACGVSSGTESSSSCRLLTEAGSSLPCTLEGHLGAQAEMQAGGSLVACDEGRGCTMKSPRA